MANDCRTRGVPIVWVLIPRVGRSSDPSARRALLESARAAAFDHIVDATDAYDGLQPGRLAVEPNDFHPNPEGHARLARSLDAALRRVCPSCAGYAASPRQPPRTGRPDTSSNGVPEESRPL